MAETAAERAARRKAIVAQARANPNSSDKGTAGAKAVEAVRNRVKKKTATVKVVESNANLNVGEPNLAQKKLDERIKAAGG